jgi:prepilin-type N-terminal cleavage/methylation domain-containing protein
MSRPRVPSGPGRPNGFTLLEALIALAILAIALLLGMQLLIQTPRVVRRLDAERQAFRALEATLDSLRASGGPAENEELSHFFTAAGTPAPDDLTVSVVVEPASLPGLDHVTLTARYSVLNVAYTKKLETLFLRSE